jgi:hypothetical protein
VVQGAIPVSGPRTRVRTNGRKTKCAEKTPMRIAWGVLVRGQDFEASRLDQAIARSG